MSFKNSESRALVVDDKHERRDFAIQYVVGIVRSPGCERENACFGGYAGQVTTHHLPILLSLIQNK